MSELERAAVDLHQRAAQWWIYGLLAALFAELAFLDAMPTSHRLRWVPCAICAIKGFGDLHIRMSLKRAIPSASSRPPLSTADSSS